MKTLASYLCGEWQPGSGDGAVLVNPSTEEPVATASTEGLDFGAALAYARDRGGPALRGMTFAERGALLASMAAAIHDIREELIALALENGGNTRKDAKFDIDGASFTLAHYGDLGKELGDKRVLADGDAIQIGRTARFSGQHILTPRLGVAVHVNAFNFPAWGLAEKAAAAVLAGMPVVSKPATATAVVSHRMTQEFVSRELLPAGVLSLVCGSPGDLLSHLQTHDVLAFTGSSDTARKLRSLAGVIERSVPCNVEADSLNAAVLGPDVESGSETEGLFLADVVRDMTQKTGQKCTAIRRVLVPESALERVSEALADRLSGLVVGNPADDSVRMGPVATAAQLRDVRAGIERLAGATEALVGELGEVEAVGAPAGKGFYVGPVVRLARDPLAADAVHEHEVFGPVATVCVYDGSAEQAAAIVGRGDGGLVASLYSDDKKFFGDIVPALAPYHGRLFLGSEKIAAQSPGPGTVMPMLLHGGPGRAGGGEELGGLRGMKLYQQRTALQGDTRILSTIVS